MDYSIAPLMLRPRLNYTLAFLVLPHGAGLWWGGPSAWTSILTLGWAGDLDQEIQVLHILAQDLDILFLDIRLHHSHQPALSIWNNQGLCPPAVQGTPVCGGK